MFHLRRHSYSVFVGGDELSQTFPVYFFCARTSWHLGHHKECKTRWQGTPQRGHGITTCAAQDDESLVAIDESLAHAVDCLQAPLHIPHVDPLATDLDEIIGPPSKGEVFAVFFHTIPSAIPTQTSLLHKDASTALFICVARCHHWPTDQQFCGRGTTSAIRLQAALHVQWAKANRGPRQCVKKRASQTGSTFTTRAHMSGPICIKREPALGGYQQIYKTHPLCPITRNTWLQSFAPCENHLQTRHICGFDGCQNTRHKPSTCRLARTDCIGYTLSTPCFTEDDCTSKGQSNVELPICRCSPIHRVLL
mmetsp:Transcript_83926/g.271173  ORF Transcript_83926/g.271173 Transcript_83926/m.271173 type:complete len:308 (-) Transcript_83926:754-1677(-)